MRKKVKCESCGHLSVEYTFTLNKGLARVVTYLFDHGGPAEISKLKLTNSQYSNYPKLRYWGLAENISNGDRKGGIWALTELGAKFALGHHSVLSHAVTLNNKVVRFEGRPVFIFNVLDDYKYREDYKDMKRSAAFTITEEGQYKFL